MNDKVAAAIPFVDFLGAALGVSTEVALFDFSDLDHALVKIVNGHVSGRSVGAPATSFARKMIEEHEGSDQDFVTDYVSKTVEGKGIQSSAFFIRDEGHIVGMIGISIDPKPFHDLEDAVKAFMEAYRHGGSEEYRRDRDNLAIVRRFYDNASVEVLSIGSESGVMGQVATTLSLMGVSADALDQNGRMEVIRRLEANGTFLMKGAAADVAAALHVSLPTIYRYLQQVRRNG